MQAEIGNCLLRDIGLSLLLVVIKSARRGVHIFWIGQKRGVRIVTELSQVLRFAQKIKVTLDQLRIP